MSLPLSIIALYFPVKTCEYCENRVRLHQTSDCWVKKIIIMVGTEFEFRISIPCNCNIGLEGKHF